MGQQQHGNEQPRDDPGASLDFFEVTAEHADDDIRDQAKGDTVGNILCKGHDR